MEFLKKILGSSETGYKPGGIISLLVGALGGYLAGGTLLTGAFGLAGGVMLAPLINEVLFSVGRHAGMITPPPRSETITPKIPTVEVPAPVRQPGGVDSTTVVHAPLLENLQPPELKTISENFARRAELWKRLRDKTGTEAEYSAAVEETRKLETKVDTFIATIDKYDDARQEYHKKGGKRDELMAAVRTSLLRPGIKTQLSETELERFVPTLPAMDAAARTRAQQLLADALPETMKLGGKEVNIRRQAYREYVRRAGSQPADKIKESWDNKTSLERINTAMNLFDDVRYNFDYKAQIDWKLITGDDKLAQELRDAEPEKQLALASSYQSMPVLGGLATISNDATRRRDAEIDNLVQLAKARAVHAYLEEHVKESLGKVMGIYTDFRNGSLVPATNLAHEFASSRLNVFNETGIAILEKGKLEASKAPDGKDCQFLTYKDCTKPDAKEVTLVMQADAGGNTYITHRLEGGMQNPSAVDWNKAKLKDAGIPVNAATFVNLTPENSQTIGASIRAIIEAATKAPLASAPLDTAMRGFQQDNPGLDMILTSNQGSAPQPVIPSSSKEKKDNPLIRSRAEMTV